MNERAPQTSERIDERVQELMQVVADVTEAGTTETNHMVVVEGIPRMMELARELTAALTPPAPTEPVVTISREEYLLAEKALLERLADQHDPDAVMAHYKAAVTFGKAALAATPAAQDDEPCRECTGTGRKAGTTCKACDGMGVTG